MGEQEKGAKADACLENNIKVSSCVGVSHLGLEGGEGKSEGGRERDGEKTEQERDIFSQVLNCELGNTKQENGEGWHNRTSIWGHV